MIHQTQRHPLYGDIPLVEKRVTGADGREYSWVEYDPTFTPPLPPGAVRGDVSEQDYCRAHHVPKYYYVDEERTCVACASDFVFRAEEQKFWYETLKFNFSSVAVRCTECRRKDRTEKELREEIAIASQDLQARPGDHHVLVALARATVRYREMTGQGNLERAIGACRRAREEWPLSHEALFWEAKCHKLAGRSKKACQLFGDFIAAAASDHRLSRLVVEATGEVKELSPAGAY